LSGIVALIVAAFGWLFGGALSTGRALVVVIVVTPLLFAFPRLLRGNRRTYAWATLAVIPYFVFAITEAVANPQQRLWSASCLSVSLLLFVALIAYLRATRPT
jgi:uncharacterized membrane protein